MRGTLLALETSESDEVSRFRPLYRPTSGSPGSDRAVAEAVWRATGIPGCPDRALSRPAARAGARCLDLSAGAGAADPMARPAQRLEGQGARGGRGEARVGSQRSSHGSTARGGEAAYREYQMDD